MFELFLKIFVSPEDIFGIILEVFHILTFCLLYIEFKEAWWKAFLPFYNVYLLYKHSWKHKWFFLLEYLFLFIESKSFKLIKSEIIVNIFDLIKDILEKRELGVDFDIKLVIICLIVTFIFSFLVFLMRRITYFKIAKKFNYNIFQIICIIISPIFFFFFIVYNKYKDKNDNK